jgi:hypothetical protein
VVVPLLEVLPELLVLAELPEVVVLSEVLEPRDDTLVLPSVGLQWEAGLWKGLLQMKGGLMVKRLPVVTLQREEEGCCGQFPLQGCCRSSP